ncbi:MAG: type I secretion system permease/ATPase [Pseudomonadota bacterium]|nr:type I secretion system permease/ATPase [Pseudomonadota bacterium]
MTDATLEQQEALGSIDVKQEEAEKVQAPDYLLAGLMYFVKHYNKLFNAESLTVGLPLQNNKLTPFLFVRAAKRAGLNARVIDRKLEELSRHVLPALVILKGEGDEVGPAFVLKEMGDHGSVVLVNPVSGEEKRFASLEDFAPVYSGTMIMARPTAVHDFVTDVFRSGERWFRDTLWQFRWIYFQVAIAAVVINLIAVVSPLFVMNVYDRVVPNNAMETLTVLALGIGTAYVFDFILKVLRGYFIDTAGRGADILLSGQLYQQVLNIRLGKQGSSSGAFANQLREFESLRDFFTSATLTTLIDLPFIFVFIGVIAIIGGWVALVPLFAIPIVLFVSFTVQSPMKAIIQQAMQDLDAKHGHLVETINGLEAIKSLNMQSVMQSRWEQSVGAVARVGQRTRLLASIGQNFAGFIQQMVTVGIVVVGVFMIKGGYMSVGALVACTLLAGRTMAPLSQAVALYARYNQAMQSLETLNGIMDMEVERPDGKNFVYLGEATGQVEFKDVSFVYPNSPLESVKDMSFKIQPGEKVAVIGRTGSGKSSLLRLMLNLYNPTQGSILFDDLEIRQVDPVEVRKNIGYVPQNIILFSGTLRHNIMLSAPHATQEQLKAAVEMSGVNEFASKHPMGLDMPVGERGDSLSGGQRQAVSLARAILKEPPILLLDEPTSEMDNRTEMKLLGHLKKAIKDKTVVLVTHKYTMLDLVDRVIVMEDGRILADGPKEDVLKSLSGKNKTTLKK